VSNLLQVANIAQQSLHNKAKYEWMIATALPQWRSVMHTRFCNAHPLSRPELRRIFACPNQKLPISVISCQTFKRPKREFHMRAIDYLSIFLLLGSAPGWQGDLDKLSAGLGTSLVLILLVGAIRTVLAETDNPRPMQRSAPPKRV
jgi:hypothetical protein